jgi:hypothetical protein
MNCRDVEAGGLAYRFCADDFVGVADPPRAVVRWVVQDEITEEAPGIEFTVTSEHPALKPRIASGGVMGLVGRPVRLFPGLGDPNASVELGLSVAARGYLPRALRAVLGPINGFPDSFKPADLGIVALHRSPVVLRGCVARRAGLGATALEAAEISIVGVWRTFPSHDVDPNTVVEPARLLSLHPGLYTERFLAGDSSSPCHMDPAVDEDKTLLAPAVHGERKLRLSDRVALNVGDVLAIDPDDGDRTEYITVTGVKEAASTDDQPATVTLAHPVALEHRKGARCVRVTPQALGAPVALSRDGIPGDRVVFLDSLAGITPEPIVVEISGPGGAAEYQIASRYETTSDTDGYYRLPPLSRLASLRIRAEHSDLAVPLHVVVSPDYRRFEHRIDLIAP